MKEKITGNRPIRVNWHVYEDFPVFYRIQPSTGEVNIRRYNTLNAVGNPIDLNMTLVNGSTVQFLNTYSFKNNKENKFYRIV